MVIFIFATLLALIVTWLNLFVNSVRIIVNSTFISQFIYKKPQPNGHAQSYSNVKRLNRYPLLPPSRQPILLMVDRQTTGGYPKIAHIITAVLHRVAQLGPKQTINFELVTLQLAEQAYIQLDQQLRLLRNLLTTRLS